MARSGKRRQKSASSSPVESSPPPADYAPLVPPQEQRLLNGPAALDREVLAWLLLGLFALFVTTFSVLRLPGKEQNNPLTFDRATFASMSAVTLTGIQQDVSISPFVGTTIYVQITLTLVTMAAAIVTLIAGGLPACRVLGLTYSAGRIALASTLLVVGGTLIGGVVMCFAGRTPVEAFLFGASAIANSGVTWGTLPRSDSPAAQLCLFPLAFIGGLGVPVILDVYDRLRGRTRELLPHTRTVLILAVSLYAIGTLLLLAADEQFWRRISQLASYYAGGASDTHAQWSKDQWRVVRSQLVQAASFAADSRSAGLPFANLSVASLSRSAQWIVLLLMLIGSAPASTGGGLRTTTLWSLLKGVLQGMRGERLPPAAGFAIAWVVAFAAFVIVGNGVLLTLADALPGDRPLFLVISAVSNGGMSHDAISLTGKPLHLLTLLMALGRVTPIVLAWMMARRVDYAETTAG